MDKNTHALYQQVILEHNKKPRNFCKIESATHQADGNNPLCGDRYTVYLKIKGDVVEELSFEGSGCAISKASASMMTTHLKGKKVDEVEAIFAAFHHLLTNQDNSDAAVPELLGKLKLFSGIWKYPSRVKCASLSWHAMKTALNGAGQVSTE